MVETVKGYAAHEKNTLEAVINARNIAMKSGNKSVAEQAKSENILSGTLKSLFALSENYPDLKSNQTMIQAMEGMKDVEEHIAAARRFYNSAVNELNNAVEIFPSNLVANMLGIKQAVFFEIPENEKQSIHAGDYFK